MDIFQVNFQQGDGRSKRAAVTKVFYDLDGDLHYEVAGGTGYAKCLSQLPLCQQGQGQLVDFLEATDVTTLVVAYLGGPRLADATPIAESAVFSFRADADGAIELRRGEDSSLVARLTDEGWSSPLIPTSHPRVYFAACHESPLEYPVLPLGLGRRSRLSPLAARTLVEA